MPAIPLPLEHRPAVVRIADIGREEFEKAHRGELAGRRDKRWNDAALSTSDDEIVHRLTSTASVAHTPFILQRLGRDCIVSALDTQEDDLWFYRKFAQ